MTDIITNNLDLWTTAIKRKSSSGRGSNSKTELYGIKKLRELILELAVRGLLVPQDPNDEPASELLKKIKAEKARLVKEKKIKKQKALPPISEEEKPFELPEEWWWVRAGQVSVLTGGFAYKSKEFVQHSQFQVIRMGNIRPDYLRVDKNAVFISKDYADTTEEYKILRGDILLTMTGTKGKRDYLYSLVVNTNDLKRRSFYLNQRLCIVRSIEIDNSFLNMVMKDDRMLDAIYAKSTGSANQANIGMDAISNWIIPLPPIEEQHRIVNKVNKLMTLCDQLKTQLNRAQSTQLHLADAIAEQAIA